MAVGVSRTIMLARTTCATIVGVRGTAVTIEVYLSRGLPAFSIVGLPGPSVRESRDRIRAALENSGFDFPLRRIVVNLAPAEIRKEGTSFDLSIALGVLAAAGRLPADRLAGLMVVGELSLDGTLRGVRGVLPAALEARRGGLRAIMAPRENADEAAVAGLPVLAAGDLAEAVRLVGDDVEGRTRGSTPRPVGLGGTVAGDYADVRGLPRVLRAVEIAAAGRHDLLLVGPPGSGKTMVARRLPGILPPLDDEEAMEVTEIQSVAGVMGSSRAVAATAPFRSPHCSASAAAVLGGGSPVRPGEVTLAHRGILFLDEFTEFARPVREGLRAPLSDRSVTVARVAEVVTMPADFQFVAAANPCPCGFLGDPRQGCSCSEAARAAYGQRISGPILDRVDLHISVPRVEPALLSEGRGTADSATMAARVASARSLQARRFEGQPFRVNGRVPPGKLRQMIPLSPSCRSALVRAAETYGVGPRGLDAAVRVARTIADLSGDVTVGDDHVIEAMTYRIPDQSRRGTDGGR